MTPTSAMREPTTSEFGAAQGCFYEWMACDDANAFAITEGWERALVGIIARALAAASDAMKERAARYHIERAQVHARDATWIGPNRERYEGARVEGVEMSPMNGPAIAYDREMADAAAIRALEPEEGTT